MEAGRIVLITVLILCAACGSNSSTEDASIGDAGTLMLQAFGGDGLTIVTQSFQNSPTTGPDFDVTLQ
jgi:hypothetical protein